MSKRPVRWVIKYRLDDKPLISLKLASCEIRLYKQKETNSLACMKLCQKNASISLHSGLGSKLIGTQRIIYGHLPSRSVSVVATAEEKTKIDTVVTTNAFLIVAPLAQVTLEFKSSDGITIQEREVPAFKRQRASIIIRFKHLLHNLRLSPTSKSDVFLHK